MDTNINNVHKTTLTMYIKLHPQCTYNYINNVHIPTYIKLHPQCTYNYIYNVQITTSTIIYKTNIDNVHKTNKQMSQLTS